MATELKRLDEMLQRTPVYNIPKIAESMSQRLSGNCAAFFRDSVAKGKNNQQKVWTQDIYLCQNAN
jgi:hypothetical protein